MTEPLDQLSAYLREANENISAFAAGIGRAPSTLTRALAGERNASMDLALDVERGTHGKVSAGQFLQICLDARAKVSSQTTPAPEAIAS